MRPKSVLVVGGTRGIGAAIAQHFADMGSMVTVFGRSEPKPYPRVTFVPTDVGGARLAWLALGKPGLDWEHGGYYVANRLARTSPVAADPVIAARLWERSAEMVGL